jgi:hypothetical protein
MKVRDLIKELKQMPADAEVYLANHDYSLGQGDKASAVLDMNFVDPEDGDESSHLIGKNAVVIQS